jgi:hypothetical protein
MLALFIAADPTAWDYYIIMADCEFARTPEMLALFIAADPTAWYCRLMIQACGDFARTPEITTRALAAA